MLSRSLLLKGQSTLLHFSNNIDLSKRNKIKDMMESNSWVEDSVNSKEVDQQKDDKKQIIEENKIAPVSIY